MKDTCQPSRVFHELVKPSDGPVSRYINRRVSLTITCFLVNRGITPSPNKLTVLSTIFGFITAIVVYYNPLIGGILVEVASILDGIDGEIARLTKKSSRFGAFLDSVLDRFVDIAVLTAGSPYLLSILAPDKALLIASWLISSSLMVSFLHARGEASLGTNLRQIGASPYATRDVRLFLYSIALILYDFNPCMYLILVVIIAVLSTAYVIHRILVAYRGA